MSHQEDIPKHGPLCWETYEEKLSFLDIIFKFIPHAFENLPDPKKRKFVKELATRDASEKATARIEKAKATMPEHAMDSEMLEVAKKIFEAVEREEGKSRFLPQNHLQYAEWVKDGMTNAQILFRVTIFGDFMKHVQTELLRADPSSLNVRADKGLCLSKVLESPDTFIDRQIARQVAETDNGGMKKRLDYFNDRIKIDLSLWRTHLIEIAEIRNNVAHGNPLHPPTKDDTTLPLEDIAWSVGRVLREAMKSAFDQAQAKHPARFLLS